MAEKMLPAVVFKQIQITDFPFPAEYSCNYSNVEIINKIFDCIGICHFVA